MGTPDPVRRFSSFANQEQKKCNRRPVLAYRVFLRVGFILIGSILMSLLVGSYAVQSQPASLLAFISPQGEPEEEPADKLDLSSLNSAVFGPRPAPSPLPSPITALPNPDLSVPPSLNQKPLPQIPSTAADFLRPRPPLGVEVVIHLGKQRLTVARYKKVILESPISSGRATHPSTSGNFEVTQKDLHHYSNLYGYRVHGRYRPASMKYFVRYNGAEGLHAGALPGYPASHGCIRLPTNKAAAVFKTVGIGTPVLVTRGSHRSVNGQKKRARTADISAN
jgi:hypothetical protein